MGGAGASKASGVLEEASCCSSGALAQQKKRPTLFSRPHPPAALNPFRICLPRRQIPGPAGRLMPPSLRSRCFDSRLVQCQGRFSPWVLVQVHFLDPYKHFRPFLLVPVHDWDLYKHSDSALSEKSISAKISMQNPAIIQDCRGLSYADNVLFTCQSPSGSAYRSSARS